MDLYFTVNFAKDSVGGPENLLGMGGGVQPARRTFAVCYCLSGALRQEKLELSAQVKKLHATVDYLQGSLNQVHEEVTLQTYRKPKGLENKPREL